MNNTPGDEPIISESNLTNPSSGLPTVITMQTISQEISFTTDEHRTENENENESTVTTQPSAIRMYHLTLNDKTENAAAEPNTPNVPNILSNTNIAASISEVRVVDEPSPPQSLLSAPPSYAFVMRQTANRQRTRYMGTFLASPSFVQHAPPPTYATSFDLYVEPPIAPPVPPPRSFGLNPMLLVCPECGNLVLTAIKSQITLCTHLCAGLLCLCFCWICAPIPYLLRTCKNVYHTCPICRTFLGMYSPTNTNFSV